MSIANRLEKFIEIEKLSKSAFAQKIGIQRSTLAHFFSGRNKPSSDFFLKIPNIKCKLKLKFGENTAIYRVFKSLFSKEVIFKFNFQLYLLFIFSKLS